MLNSHVTFKTYEQNTQHRSPMQMALQEHMCVY